MIGDASDTINELRESLKGILKITDRKHVAWARARIAIAKSEGRAPDPADLELLGLAPKPDTPQQVRKILDRVLVHDSTLTVDEIARALLADERNHPGTGYDSNFGIVLAMRVLGR